MQQWGTKKSLVNWIFSTGGLHQQNLWFICPWVGWVGTDLPDSSAGWHTSNPLKEIALSTMNSLSHQLHWKRLHCGRIKSNANDYHGHIGTVSVNCGTTTTRSTVEPPCLWPLQVNRPLGIPCALSHQKSTATMSCKVQLSHHVFGH